MGIGAYQDDAMQKITGKVLDIVYQDLSYNAAYDAFYIDDNSKNARFSLRDDNNIRTSGSPIAAPNKSTGDGLVLDTSRVVRTSSETRGKATRFALRLAAC